MLAGCARGIHATVQAAADYYAILGVAPGAESAAVRTAYRNLMRRHHPDVNPSDDAAAMATAINEAYDCLRDPDKRAAYDRQRSAGEEPPPFTASGPRPYRARHTRPRPTWQPHHAQRAPIKPEPLPKKWHRLSLVLATLLTGVIFALTSATPPPMPLPPPDVTLVQAQPDAAQGDPGCDPVRQPGSDACEPGARSR